MISFVREPYRGDAPLCWVDALFRAVDGIAAACPGRAAAAVAVTGAGPALVPVAGDGRALGLLPWSASGAAYHGPSLFLPGLAAFRERNPSVYSASVRFFSSQEWLSHVLGADPVTVLPHAAYAPYYWDERQCAAVGVDAALFPPFVSMGCCIGRVRGEKDFAAVSAPRPPASFKKLLPEGTPLLAGGPDFIMALIGTAVLEPGMICDRAGTSEGINLCIGKAEYDRLKELQGKGAGSGAALRLLPHAVPGLYNAAVIIPRSGALFEEFRVKRNAPGGCGQESAAPEKVYAALMDEIAGDGNHPARAVLGRMAANVKAALETLKAAAGIDGAGPLILSGGQAKSRIWNQMKADTAGAVLLVPEIPDGELTGCAVLGALFLERTGDGKDFAARLVAKARAVVRIRERYVPRG
jgi:xylulokinase